MRWQFYDDAGDIEAELGVSQWLIRTEGKMVGRVTVNGIKGSATFTPQGEETALTRFLQERAFAWWVTWLECHVKQPIV